MTRPDSSDSMPERIGPYKLVRALGKGGMGVVYEGVDTRLNRRVAIKTARMDRIDPGDLEARERFLREARAAAALNHPGIITIYEADEWEGGLFIAMEFVEGTDLAGWVKRNGPPSVELAVDWLATLAETLAFAHRRGIIHRDIKPANILVPDEGHLKITDFGIARLESSTLTQEGAVLGTPNYMSPEQFLGRKADGRADLFSLAVVGYELLTGSRPFTGDSFTAIMHHVLHTPPVPPDMLNPEINFRLRDVLLKALSKAPSDRFPDGSAFAAALRESLSPEVSRIHDAATVIATPNRALAETRLADVPPNTDIPPMGTTVRSTDKTLETATAGIAVSPTGRIDPDVPLSAGEAAASAGVSSAYRSKQRGPILTIAAVVLAGIFGILFFTEWRQPGPEPASSNPSPATVSSAMDIAPVTPAEPAPVEQPQPKNPPPPAAAAVPTPSIRLAYYLYVTASPEVFRGFPVSPEEQEEYLKSRVASGEVSLWKNSNTVIVVQDTSGGKNTTVVNEPVPESGRGIIRVPANAKSLRFEIRDATGLTLTEAEYKDSAWDSARHFLVLR